MRRKSEKTSSQIAGKPSKRGKPQSEPEFPDSIKKLRLVASYFAVAFGPGTSMRNFNESSGTGHATIHRTVQAFEKYYGIELFDRPTRNSAKPKIDAATKAFVDEFCRRARLVNQWMDSLKNIRPGSGSNKDLRVAMYPSMVSYLGPALSHAFAGIEPQIRLSFHQAGNEEGTQGVAAGVFDLAIAADPLPLTEGLKATPLQYRLPLPGIVFPLPSPESPSCGGLAKLLEVETFSVAMLKAALAENPLVLLGRDLIFPENDAVLDAVDRLFFSAEEQLRPPLFFVPTYRHGRILGRALLGAAIGPPPEVKDDSSGVVLGDAFIGYDVELPNLKLGFIPARYLTSHNADQAALPSFAAYSRVDKGKGAHREASAAVTKRILDELEKLCAGDLGDFGYLRFEDSDGLKFLLHNYVR